MSRRRIGTITKRPTGAWHVEVPAGRDPITGKRRRLSRDVYGSDREAERELSRLLLEAGKVPRASLTLADYLEDMYLPSLEPPKVRRRTRDEYESKLRLYVTPYIGQVKLVDLEPYTLDRWQATLAAIEHPTAATRKDAHPTMVRLSPRSRMHAYRVLHSALERAVRWRLIPANPLDAVDQPTVPRYEPDVLDADEANAYLDAFAGHVLEPIVVLALGAGLRRSELCALTWRDVDLKAGTVRIERGAHERSGEVWTEAPKSDTSRRIVSLPSWAIAALRPYKALGPLVSENGTAMRPSLVSALYVRRVAEAGLRRVPLKNLRHTHATLALESGVDLYAVSKRLGHSSPAVTDAFYLRPGRAMDEDAAAKVDTIRQNRDGERRQVASDGD